MIYLREGDAEPKVCAAQVLLNRRGTALQVDGHFGPKTRQAVVEFQRRQGLAADGTVEAKTWAKLVDGSPLGVIDALDFSDAVMPKEEGPQKGRIVDTSTPALRDLRAAGAEPIVTGAMSGALRDVVGQIRLRAAQKPAVLLRFFGHGWRGQMDLGGYTVMALKFLDKQAGTLSTLTPHFARFGSVEMHGCKVASGTAGRLFVSRLARLWGVPVTAGLDYQYDSGSAQAAVRFEGPTFTAYPSGGNLKGWARQFALISV
jgi:hypothetical protein